MSHRDSLYKCHVCGKYRACLISHMKVHQSKEVYPCSECDQSFPYDCKLKKHMMLHLFLRKHHCKICRKGFIKSRDWRSHMARHSREKSESVSFIYRNGIDPPQKDDEPIREGLCKQTLNYRNKKNKPPDFILGLKMESSRYGGFEFESVSKENVNELGELTFDEKYVNIKKEDFTTKEDPITEEEKEREDSMSFDINFVNVEEPDYFVKENLILKDEQESVNITFDAKRLKAEKSDFFVKEEVCDEEQIELPCTSEREFSERFREDLGELRNVKKENESAALSNRVRTLHPRYNFNYELIMVKEAVGDADENDVDPLA